MLLLRNKDQQKNSLTQCFSTGVPRIGGGTGGAAWA